jgi:serine/threonine-protein kinase RsbW
LICLMQNDMHTPAIQTDEQYTLLLPSKMESLIMLENLLDEIAGKNTIAKDTLANMMICLDEAVTNAIAHGDNSAGNRKVSINAVVQRDRIIFTVADEGEGFDYNSLADPVAFENLENSRGRGVFIMKHLADNCIFNAKGNKVELHFTI